MGISQGLEISLRARKMRLQDIDVPLAQSTKSMIKNGQRKLPADIAPKIAKAVGHPALIMEIAHELSGGYGAVWLDGPNVDLHRSSVKERAVTEMQEAMEALNNFRTSNPPCTATDSDKRKLDSLLTELLDASQWVNFLIGVMCIEYDVDMLEVHEKHHQRLRSLRLVTN